MVKNLSFSQLGGANTNVSPFLRPDDNPCVLNTVNITHQLGSILKDTGYDRVGDVTTNKEITGLYDFHQNSTTQKILRTKNSADGLNLVLEYNNAGTWTNIALSNVWDGFEDSKVEMEGFIGYCFFVGYDANDDVYLPVGSLTGTTFSTTTNVTNMPQGKFIKRYRDRIYVANTRSGGTTYEHRIYYSSVPEAGAITWTPATDFIDVDFGEQITGISVNWDRLVVFTENACYFYDQNQFKKVFEVGCSNNRTIANQSVYMVWSDYDGTWMSTGGQPQNVAGPVIDFVRNGSPRNFFSTIVDEEYREQVGNVTVNGVTYANCELRYYIPASTWSWREYLSDTPSIYARYNDGGKIRQYIGMSDGDVMNKGKYTDASVISTDDGNAIGANFELAPIHFGEFGIKKGIKQLHAFAERAQGLTLKYRVLDRSTLNLTPYMPLGQLTRYINSFDVSKAADGVMLQIAGQEYSSLPYFSFFGFELDMVKTSKLLK